MREQSLFLNGEWVGGRDTFDVTDPYDSTLVGTVAEADTEQIAAAVAAASDAMRTGLAARDRATILRDTSRRIAERADDFAECLRAEAGKPITAARAEVARAVETIKLAGEEASRLPGETVNFDPQPNGIQPWAFTVPFPAGVVAAITPFNFPLNLVAHKVAPALAAGCAVVLKPSERTPLTAGLLTEALTASGLPAGWLNLITGKPDEIVPLWSKHPDVAVVTFTGSAEIGWKLKEASVRKRHILELGSNTALVVDADADLDRAVEAVASGGYAFSGQACVSVQRVYVHRAVATEFASRLTSKVAALPAGDTKDPDTVVGPLVSTAGRDRVRQWIDEAVAQGARLLTGGQLDGNVLRPTVLAEVPANARVVCEEVFGPVVALRTVDSVDEAVEEVNSSRYGLNTAIFTANLPAAMAFARQAEAGTVMVNVSPTYRGDHMPYGGVKDSGQGREGVKYAITELLDERLVLLSE